MLNGIDTPSLLDTIFGTALVWGAGVLLVYIGVSFVLTLREISYFAR